MKQLPTCIFLNLLLPLSAVGQTVVAEDEQTNPLTPLYDIVAEVEKDPYFWSAEAIVLAELLIWFFWSISRARFDDVGACTRIDQAILEFRGKHRPYKPP